MTCKYLLIMQQLPNTTNNKTNDTNNKTNDTNNTQETELVQEKLKNNLEELHRSAQAIFRDYTSIGWYGGRDLHMDMTVEHVKHNDFQKEKSDKNADLEKVSGGKTLAPVIEKETIANDNAVINNEDRLIKEMDKKLEDNSFKPYDNEMSQGFKRDVEINLKRRSELMAEREEYLRTRNLELEEIINKENRPLEDRSLEDEAILEQSEHSDFNPFEDSDSESANINERSESEIDLQNIPEYKSEGSKSESPNIKVESESDIDLQNIPEYRSEESEDSDLYGPAPEIPKSNKRKFDEISQGEGSQQQGPPPLPPQENASQRNVLNAGDNVNILNSPILSQIDPNVWVSSQQQDSQQQDSQQQDSQQQDSQQQVDNKKEKSILDEYADLSQEPADYFGGDD